MTVTYSLEVASARFCGFTKLLTKWKGSIYKILWKELFCFVIGYTILSITYRLLLNTSQKRMFENVVMYCQYFTDLIPLSFVLGFYVTLVIGRWWQQYEAIAWPDKTCYIIGAVVQGTDDRSRIIRRTLGRYLILMQMFAFQAVSTAVKKRFPTVAHIEYAGLITEEERAIYEKVNIPYSKWWLPAHWFSALAMRAKKEGRISDSVMFKTLIEEFIKYRSICGDMFSYDWISVPLVYTQVVTLATYTYTLSLLMGRQYLDPAKGYQKHEVDLYVPIFTLLQVFFYVGWLKVAEQLVNPYGEDDDDFELNWCLDRNTQIVYLLVDHFHMKHPKLRKDRFFDEFEPKLPQTKFTAASHLANFEWGSTANLEIDPTKFDFLPLETLMEEDHDENEYDSSYPKKRRSIHYRPSILMSILNSGIGQSFRKKFERKNSRSGSFQGITNPGFSENKSPQISFSHPKKQSFNGNSRKNSRTNHGYSPSISFLPNNSVNRHERISFDLQQLQSYNKSMHNKFLAHTSLNEGVENFIVNRTDEAAIVKDLWKKHKANDELVSGEGTSDRRNSCLSEKDIINELMESPVMPSISEESSTPTDLGCAPGTYSKGENNKGKVYELELEANQLFEQLDSSQDLRESYEHLDLESYSLDNNDNNKDIKTISNYKLNEGNNDVPVFTHSVEIHDNESQRL